MAADDSTTDSQLFHGSLITRAFFKKPKANWLTNLKQRKIDDPRRSQWIHQRKRANVVGEDQDNIDISRLRSLPPDIKRLSHRFAHLQAWSLLKNKDDYSDALEHVTEEEQEEALIDDYSVTLEHDEEGPSQSNNNKSSSSSSTAKPPEKPTDQKKEEEDEYCPVCTENMDATDLLFKPCSFCVLKLCLFCYNKVINEGTGDCPGCRKKYEKQQTSSGNSGVVTFQQPGGDSVPLSSSFQGLDSE